MTVMSARQSKLQREIAQTKPFRSLGHEAAVSILRTSDVLKRRINEIVALEGLTQQQYNVLRILRGAEPEGLPTLAIAERMIERTPGITGLIDRLAEKGLVRRTRCREDRRRVFCHIADEGLDVLTRLDGPVAAHDDELRDRLSDAELEALVLSLDKVRESA